MKYILANSKGHLISSTNLDVIILALHKFKGKTYKECMIGLKFWSGADKRFHGEKFKGYNTYEDLVDYAQKHEPKFMLLRDLDFNLEHPAVSITGSNIILGYN